MTKLKIPANLTRSLHKVGFQLKKHSPEIMIVAGTVGAVASTIMACKATLKVHEVVDGVKSDIDDIHEAAGHGYTKAGEKYSEEDAKKDLSIVYIQTGVKFVKLYGPSVALGAASLGCMIASNRILRKCNLALAAAYATEHLGFKEYRGRVVERFGEAMDRELKYNIKAKEIEETVVNEDGTESTVTKTVEVIKEPSYGSTYARYFDECSAYWERSSEYNLMFLRRQQDYANEMLRANGFLYLNDVYKMLGIQQTRAGQVVGWVLNGDGDGYVDFGIYNLYDEDKRAFVNGYEKSILLDFNVDGNILDLMA